MLKKFTNKKGFTLMEMLIVVAIIAVLVAIAIPTFSNSLTKAKEAADVANVRALYAEWQIAMMTDGENLPADKTAYLKGTTLNDDGNLKYTKDTSGKTATIAYEADVLKNSEGGDTFTWTLSTVS